MNFFTSTAVVVLTFLLLLAYTGLITEASCTGSDGPCQAASGDCTTAVRLALGGDLAAAVDAAWYGKYCGARNKCQVVDDNISSSSRSSSDDSDDGEEMSDQDDSVCLIEDDRRRLHGKQSKTKSKKNIIKKKKNKKEKSAQEPCPAIPCDAIDTACSFHDACLDNELLINPPDPDEQRIPVPQRCVCDVDLVFDMIIQTYTTAPTGRCDAAFYNETISAALPGVTPIDLLQHEALFVAGPFCCIIALDQDGNGIPDCGEDVRTDPAKFAVAAQFCQQIVAGLASAGIQVCR
jgi:hypothetical protein